MQQYIGVKHIKAHPMTRGAYNALRGWDLPDDENPDDAGYLVEYLNSPATDMPGGFTNYISWSPKAVFEDSYWPVAGLSFGLAVEAAKKDPAIRIARKGWNGKGAFVVVMPALYLPPYSTQGTARKVNDRTATHIGEDTPLDSQPYFAMFTADKKWQPGWTPSAPDCLTNDWFIV